MHSDCKANILLIDDHVENLIALEALLGGMGQNLVKARSGAEALRCLLNQDFAVILLDVQMPDMDGFETASLIRQRERSQHTPIIFVTAFNTNDVWRMKGYALGAVDYLLKPIDPAVLISKVTVFVELFKKTQEVQRQAAELAAQKIEIIREQLARQQAESASRMKDEFLAIVSHELRTPLNAILGWSRLLAANKLDSETTERALEIISRNAQSQAQIIDDILDVARLMRGKIRLVQHAVNLVNLIETERESMQPLAEAKGLRLYSQLPAQACTVFGDAERLQQIIRNLLSNAIKFTPTGGEVEVRLERIKSDRLKHERPAQDAEGLCAAEGPMRVASPSSFRFQVVPEYAQITIRDTGIGINPEFLPYIFEYFRQADSSSTRAHGGLGLGLAIVRQLVDLHGGAIYASSEGDGQGTTFTIQLPLQTAPSPAYSSKQNPPDSNVEKPASLAQVSVLIVDDNDDNRDFITMVLTQAGAQVTALATGDEVMAYLQEAQPNVFVSDIAMPEENGYALIQRVRELEQQRGGHMPAIALTAYAKQEDQQQALEAGFQEFLSKPVEPAELIQAVAKLANVQVPLR